MAPDDRPPAPLPRAPARSLALPLAAAVVVVLVIAGAFWRFGGGGDGRDPVPDPVAASATIPNPDASMTAPTTAPTTAPPYTGPSVTAPVSPTPGPTATPTPTSTPTPSPTPDEAAAQARLQALRAAGLRSVRLRGQVVVQLSSKYVGITDPRQVAANGTHRFLAGDILAEHEALRERLGTSAQVVLLLSTDFGSRYRDRGRALWVTLATRPFGSIAQAARWCQGRFPGLSGKDLANVCLPRTLPPPA